jgi:hypothetical protein
VATKNPKQNIAINLIIVFLFKFSNKCIKFFMQLLLV